MTLRTRLVILLVALVASVGVAGLAIAVTQHQYLVEQLDRQLETIARPVAAIPPGLLSTAEWPIDAPGSFVRDIWVGYVAPGPNPPPPRPWVRNGSTAPALGSRAIAALPPNEPTTVPAKRGGGNVRLVTVPLENDSGTVAIAVPLERVDEATSRLALALWVGTVVITVIACLLGWWVWRLGLRPIRRMTATAEAIAAGDENKRIGPQVAGTEAAHLGESLNAMLDERQRAEDRLRQFVADASHELRTPLTSIRGYADMFERGGFENDPVGSADAIRRIRQESARMASLVDEMLLLASLDQRRPLNLDQVDLARLMADAADDAIAASPDRELVVHAPGPLLIQGDEDRLRQLLGALLHNAVGHTVGRIELVGAATDDTVTIDVVDEGPGMPPEVAGRVFERFYRGDAGRSRGTGGAGLGLTIAESIVDAHHGALTLTTDPASGSRFHIELPRSHQRGDLATSLSPATSRHAQAT